MVAKLILNLGVAKMILKSVEAKLILKIAEANMIRKLFGEVFKKLVRNQRNERR